MFNSVQYVRDICQARNIAICTLERDCGFANGYLNPKKLKKIPYDRAIAIANYLDVPVNIIYNGPQTEKTPTETSERQVTDEDIKFALFRGRENITDEMYQEVRNFADYVAQREEAKNKEK